MKFYYVMALTALCGLGAGAQTNNLAPRAATRIESKVGEFDITGNKAIYIGAVRVTSPEMKLTCEQLVANLPPSGGQPDHIVCETNVVIDFTDEHGQTNHVTSEKAVYDFHVQNGVTNDTVTLTGSPKPKVENAQSITVADVIVWDRANNRFQFTNQKMIFRQSPNIVRAATNPPAANANNWSVPK
jgi:lipopolysaccharide export system protein LptA